MFKVIIDRQRCKGCNLCIDVCPKNLIKAGTQLNQKGYYVVDMEKSADCSGCKYCALICPEVAIEIIKDE